MAYEKFILEKKKKVLPIGIQGETGLSPNAPMPIRGNRRHLEHAISILETEKAKMFDSIGRFIGTPGDAGELRLNQLSGIIKAISILNAKKIKEIELAEKKF